MIINNVRRFKIKLKKVLCVVCAILMFCPSIMTYAAEEAVLLEVEQKSYEEFQNILETVQTEQGALTLFSKFM